MSYSQTFCLYWSSPFLNMSGLALSSAELEPVHRNEVYIVLTTDDSAYKYGIIATQKLVHHAPRRRSCVPDELCQQRLLKCVCTSRSRANTITAGRHGAKYRATAGPGGARTKNVGGQSDQCPRQRPWQRCPEVAQR